MKLFLLKDVKNFGKAGETKEVSPTYARNFLIPKGLAVEPNDSKAIELREKKIAQKKELMTQKENDIKRVDNLNGQTFVFLAKVDKNGHLYGSIGPKEISAKIGVSENLIKTHYKELGQYTLEIIFSDDLKASVKIEIKKEE